MIRGPFWSDSTHKYLEALFSQVQRIDQRPFVLDYILNFLVFPYYLIFFIMFIFFLFFPFFLGGKFDSVISRFTDGPIRACRLVIVLVMYSKCCTRVQQCLSKSPINYNNICLHYFLMIQFKGKFRLCYIHSNSKFTL